MRAAASMAQKAKRLCGRRQAALPPTLPGMEILVSEVASKGSNPAVQSKSAPLVLKKRVRGRNRRKATIYSTATELESGEGLAEAKEPPSSEEHTNLPKKKFVFAMKKKRVEQPQLIVDGNGPSLTSVNLTILHSVPQGKVRICIAGFNTSPAFVLCRKIADSLVAVNPGAHETWYKKFNSN